MSVRTELSPSKRIPAFAPVRSIALALTFTTAAALTLSTVKTFAQGPAAAEPPRSRPRPPPAPPCAEPSPTLTTN
jgi:hypothetical protein